MNRKAKFFNLDKEELKDAQKYDVAIKKDHAKIIGRDVWNQNTVHILLDEFIDDVIDFFSDVSKKCVVHGFPFAVSGPVKCFVKRFPFMDERWEHATYSLSEYGTFINVQFFTGVHSDKIELDENFERTLLSSYWENLQDVVTYCLLGNYSVIKPFISRANTIANSVFTRQGYDVVVFDGETFENMRPGNAIFIVNMYQSQKRPFETLIRKIEKHYVVKWACALNVALWFSHDVPKRIETVRRTSTPVVDERRRELFLELVLVFANYIDRDYELHEILDWIPFVSQIAASYRVKTISNVRKSIHKVYRARGSCVKK